MICRICLDAASEPRVTKCGHVFCFDCAQRWFLSDSTCPVCRKPVDLTQAVAVYDAPASPLRPRRAGRASQSSEQPGGSADSFGGGREVAAYLRAVADKYEEAERENRLLRIKVESLEAEVGFLKGLRESDKQRMEEALRRGEENGPASTANGADPRPPPAFHPLDGPGGDPRVEIQRARSVQDLKPARQWLIHSGPVHGIAISCEESSRDALVASASWDMTCKVTDLRGGGEVSASLQHEHGLYAVEFHPTLRNVLATAADNTCVLWDCGAGPAGRRLRCLDAHAGEVNGLAFSATGATLASASADHTLICWDVEHGKQTKRLNGHSGEVYGVRFIHKSESLLSCSFDRSIRLWDLRTGVKESQRLVGHSDVILGVDIRNEWLVASGSDDGTARLWDLRAGGKMLAALHHHSGEVKRVKFSSNGDFLATTSGDRTCRVYDVASLHCQAVLSGHSDHVFDVAWSSTDDFLVSASHDAQWSLWKPNLGE